MTRARIFCEGAMINTAPPDSNSVYPQEFHGNNALNIIIFLANIILSSVVQWSRPSVQMVQVRLSAKLCFLFGLFPIILAAGPLQPRKVFCNKRISSNFNIKLASAHPWDKGGGNGHSDLNIIFFAVLRVSVWFWNKGWPGPPGAPLNPPLLAYTYTVHALPTKVWSTWKIR